MFEYLKVVMIVNENVNFHGVNSTNSFKHATSQFTLKTVQKLDLKIN